MRSSYPPCCCNKVATAGTLEALTIRGGGSTTVESGATLQANYIDQDAIIVRPGGLMILGNPAAHISIPGIEDALGDVAAGSIGGTMIAMTVPEPDAALLAFVGAVSLLAVWYQKRRGIPMGHETL
jgi:hypothetical protein